MTRARCAAVSHAQVTMNDRDSDARSPTVAAGNGGARIANAAPIDRRFTGMSFETEAPMVYRTGLNLC